MNPQVDIIKSVDDKNKYGDALTFTLSGVNVSIANAIRRTILSDIPQVVFKTTPYEENKANIIANTSRLNNEIIKQRLSCIPIFIKDFENMPLKNYLMEVNVENNTENTIYVTTEDFKIKDLVSNKYISDSKIREIFPANGYTGDFIDFVRLRPKLSDDLPGEKINLTCDFSVSTAKENGMYNAVSTCSYGFTVDQEKMESELAKKIQGWKNEGKKEDEIDYESKNWKLLDGLRYTTKDSFDFAIESIGVYTNNELLDKACEIIIHRLTDLDSLIEEDKLEIKKSENTLQNSYDIVLENEDYTIGKTIEFMLYEKFYEGIKILSYCGFKKMHTHDSQSIIRVAYKEAVEKSNIKGHLKECIDESKKVFTKMKKEFLKLMKN